MSTGTRNLMVIHHPTAQCTPYMYHVWSLEEKNWTKYSNGACELAIASGRAVTSCSWSPARTPMCLYAIFAHRQLLDHPYVLLALVSCNVTVETEGCLHPVFCIVVVLTRPDATILAFDISDSEHLVWPFAVHGHCARPNPSSQSRALACSFLQVPTARKINRLIGKSPVFSCHLPASSSSYGPLSCTLILSSAV